MNFFEVKCALMHIVFALRKKSGSLMLFNNTLNLMGLGIAPLMILAGVLLNNPGFLRVTIIVSGVLALSTWVWTIAVYIYKINKHIELCLFYPVKIETFLNENEPSGNTPLNKTQMANLSKKANKFHLDIKAKIDEENFQVPDWINVHAQQKVMTSYNATCSSCGKTWISRRLSDKKDIKGIFKKRNKQKYCLECGQQI